jgi:hypothetical protein
VTTQLILPPACRLLYPNYTNLRDLRDRSGLRRRVLVGRRPARAPKADADDEAQLAELDTLASSPRSPGSATWGYPKGREGRRDRLHDRRPRGRHRQGPPGRARRGRRALAGTLRSFAGRISSTSRSIPSPGASSPTKTLPAGGAKIAHFCSIQLTQDVRDHAAKHGIAEETARRRRAFRRRRRRCGDPRSNPNFRFRKLETTSTSRLGASPIFVFFGFPDQ